MTCSKFVLARMSRRMELMTLALNTKVNWYHCMHHLTTHGPSYQFVNTKLGLVLYRQKTRAFSGPSI